MSRGPLQLQREGVDVLLGQYRLMDADKDKKRTVYEEAVAVLYELILYHETAQMTVDDATLVEDAATGHRPHPEPI